MTLGLAFLPLLSLGGCATSPQVNLQEPVVKLAPQVHATQPANPQPTFRLPNPHAAQSARSSTAPSAATQAPAASASKAPDFEQLPPEGPNWKILVQAGIDHPVSHWDPFMTHFLKRGPWTADLRSGKVICVRAMDDTLKMAFPASTMAPDAIGPGDNQGKALQDVSLWLAQHPQVLVKITSSHGFVPPTPTIQTAEAFANALVQDGIDSGRIALSDNGSSTVASSGASPTDPWNNRIELAFYNLSNIPPANVAPVAVPGHS